MIVLSLVLILKKSRENGLPLCVLLYATCIGKENRSERSSLVLPSHDVQFAVFYAKIQATDYVRGKT